MFICSEYYFSDDNLSRDKYLRSMMDHEGFVKLHIIFKFRRIQILQGTPVLVSHFSQSNL